MANQSCSDPIKDRQRLTTFGDVNLQPQSIHSLASHEQYVCMAEQRIQRWKVHGEHGYLGFVTLESYNRQHDVDLYGDEPHLKVV